MEAMVRARMPASAREIQYRFDMARAEGLDPDARRGNDHLHEPCAAQVLRGGGRGRERDPRGDAPPDCAAAAHPADPQPGGRARRPSLRADGAWRAPLAV